MAKAATHDKGLRCGFGGGGETATPSRNEGGSAWPSVRTQDGLGLRHGVSVMCCIAAFESTRVISTSSQVLVWLGARVQVDGDGDGESEATAE